MNKHINRQEEDIIQSYMDFKEKDNTENTELMEQNVEISKKKDEQNENEARKNPMKKKQKKSHSFLAWYAFFVTLVAITGIGLCVRFYSQNDNMNEDSSNKSSEIGASKGVKSTGKSSGNEYSEQEMKELIKEYMGNGKGTLEMLRKLFPEDIVVYHTNKYVFIPIIEGLKKNEIDNEKIEKQDDGEFVYVENGEIVSHKGIDVSKYQGDIDWKKVADSGVEFAMIRVAYRGYGTGEIVQDEKAEENIIGALDAGIKVGAYFFSQAVTEEEALEEAEFAINIIKKYNITYPVVFDTETTFSATERSKNLTVDERTKIAIAFCEKVKKEGYTPMIYANLKWFSMSLDMSQLEDYDKWFAGYNDELYFPYEISMWQYAESGKIDGIEGNVDINIGFKDFSEK